MLFVLLSMLENAEDELIFDDIYERYREATFRRALNLLNHNYHDAEDAFQMAWIKIAKNMKKIKTRNEHAIATYIMKTVEFKAINVANSNVEWMEGIEKLAANPEDRVSDDLLFTVCSKDKCKAIEEILHGMEDKYRDIMIFFYLYDLSARSIAEHMGINEKTVRTRLYRGKEILLEELKERGIHNE